MSPVPTIRDHPPTAVPDWGALRARLVAHASARTSPAEAEDIAQDVLVQMLQHVDRLDRDHVLPWALTVVRNATIDRLRRRQVRLRREQADVDHDSLPADAPSVDESEALQEALAPWVAAMVEMLPERYRHAVAMAELEGRSRREIAAELGLSESGAKSRVQRGRAQLRGLVERCCAIELDVRGRVTECTPHAPCECELSPESAPS